MFIICYIKYDKKKYFKILFLKRKKLKKKQLFANNFFNIYFNFKKYRFNDYIIITINN